MTSGRLSDGGQLRLADHDRWLAWVRAHKAEIEALAVPGFEESLLGRVRSSEFGSPTRVQRAFQGLGIPWVAEMDDAEQVRHGVAHEASMSNGPRDWDLDRARVGLVRTMLTALLAKLIGYDGPIVDRSKSCFDIFSADEPGWWPAADLDRVIDYQGSGVDEIAERTRGELERLRVEQLLQTAAE